MLPKSAMKKEKKIVCKSVNYRERDWFRDNEINPLGTTTFFTQDISYAGSPFLFRVYSTISTLIPSPFQPAYCKLSLVHRTRTWKQG